MITPRLAVDPPLVPSPDEARGRLRRELLRPDYHQDSPVQRLQEWLTRRFDEALQAASGVDGLSLVVSLLLFALLAVGLVVLLSRLRRSPTLSTGSGAVLTEERVTAAELRQRALRSLGEGRSEAALVDAFRALTVRQVELGRLDDLPGATAHEVATALETTYSPMRGRIDVAARLFDDVRYGDRSATREQAESVLALDDDLVGVR